MIWVEEKSTFEFSSAHHAPLFTELIFNYGDLFDVNGQNIQTNTSSFEDQIISGLKTKPFQTTVEGKYKSIGLLLKPHCFGLLADNIGTATMKTLSEVLYENFFEKSTPDNLEVEKYLLKMFDPNKLDPTLLKFEKYIDSNMLEKGSLKSFNEEISLSQKSFIAKFKKHYQLTPSQYLKLRKVNKAIDLIQNTEKQKLIEIGLEAGFYDQAHFIKTFKQFSGKLPKNFKK